MIKITGTVLVAVAMLGASPAFAGGGKACCVKGASNKEKAACADFAYLNVTAEQKTKLETWQTNCMKAGCHKGKSGKVSGASERDSFQRAVRQVEDRMR